MPSQDSTPTALIELFDEIDSAENQKVKSLALSKAKSYILNEMTPEMITDSFVNNKQNFEVLFSLKIWKDKLDLGMIEYTEPYDIIEKIFSNFKSLIQLVDGFNDQIMFIMNQDKDEKIKHICVIFMTKLTLSLTSEDFEIYEDPCNKITELETKIKNMLPDFFRQIPEATQSYSELISELLCQLTTKLNVIESSLIDKHHNIVAVFSSTVFDDNHALTEELHKIAKMNSTMQIRILDIFIKIAAISSDHLKNISELVYGLDNNLKELLHSHDILVKLNVIELLSNLAITFHGYGFLEKTGHLKRLMDDLLVSDLLKDTSPFGQITETAIIKLFSYIVKVMPESINANFPQYFQLLFQYATYDDILKYNSQINLAIQTFTYLFESSLIKRFIHEKYEDKFNVLLQSLVWNLQNVIDGEIKARCLICISEIVSPDPSLLHAEKISEKWTHSPWIDAMSEICENFYKSLVSNITFDVLFKLCFKLAKEPFLATRLAAQMFFKALAQSKWGLTLLFSEHESIKKHEFTNEYLIDRTIEIEHAGMQSKYELIKLICANFKINTEMFHLIGEGDLEALEEYIRLGPVFAASAPKIAFEKN